MIEIELDTYCSKRLKNTGARYIIAKTIKTNTDMIPKFL